MTAETAALRTCFGPNFNLPWRLRAWLFFKQHILEPEPLQHEPLSKAQFVQRYRLLRLVRRRGPSETRRSQQRRSELVQLCYDYWCQPLEHGCRVARTDFGLGLLATRHHHCRAHQSLTGLSLELMPLEPEQVLALRCAGHPSLTSHGVLFGTASLANHACSAEVYIGTSSLQFKPASDEKLLRLRPGQQLCINYNHHPLPFDCRCAPNCFGQQQRQQLASLLDM